MLPNWIAWSGITFVIIVLIEVMRAGRVLVWNLKHEPLILCEQGRLSVEASTPLVSVIIPAKDEERFIERSVQSVLASDYPNLELIVVNDRSVDRTEKILERLRQEDRRLSFVSISHLPSGWTGKTHALTAGAERARGEILLFTDADSIIGEDVISCTVNYLHDNNLDVLSIFPGFVRRGFSENIVYPHLALGLFYFYPLMDINNASKSAGLASGSFIMMTRQAYDTVGTWERFRNEITEDVALARAVKSEGLRLRSVRGNSLVKTKCFDGIGDLCQFWKRTYYGGLEKSIPKLSRLAVNYVALVVLLACPFLSGAALLSEAASYYEYALFVVSVLATTAVTALYAIFTHTYHGSWLYGLTAPVGILLTAWIALSTLATRLNHGGIYWRGSVYK